MVVGGRAYKIGRLVNMKVNMNITLSNMFKALLTKGNDTKYYYSFPVETLEGKILEAEKQLSQEALNFIYDDFNGDMFFGPMAYLSVIEERYFINESDEDDYDVLNHILDLLEIIMKLEETWGEFCELCTNTLNTLYPGTNK
jgi:hypothetical protein